MMYQTNSMNNKVGIDNKLPICNVTLPIDRLLILAYFGEISSQGPTYCAWKQGQTITDVTSFQRL